jgi:hypothetical protein
MIPWAARDTAEILGSRHEPGGPTIPLMRLAPLLPIALLVACGSGSVPSTDGAAQGPAVTPIEIVPPPTVLLNGVAGRPITWCGENGCVDGMIVNIEDYPVVSEPGTVAPTRLGAVEDVQMTNAEGSAWEDVPFDGFRIGEFPPGDWPVLTLFIRYRGGGDAFYAWRVDHPASSP